MWINLLNEERPHWGKQRKESLRETIRTSMKVE